MLGLARSLLSTQRGPGIIIHPMTFAFASLLPNRQLMQSSSRYSDGGWGQEERLDIHSLQKLALDNGERCSRYGRALDIFSPLLQENKWLGSLTVRFIGN